MHEETRYLRLFVLNEPPLDASHAVVPLRHDR